MPRQSQGKIQARRRAQS